MINGSDAYTTWGISLDGTGLSALMTPAPLKDRIENENALEDGKRVISTGRRYDERTLTLALNISAPTEEAFLARYASFCTELAKGRLVITTSFQSGVVYRFDYLSCQQFSEWQRGVGKFSLRLSEPNPTNRGPVDTDEDTNTQE